MNLQSQKQTFPMVSNSEPRDLGYYKHINTHEETGLLDEKGDIYGL
jgi:hypothetical protein